MVADRDPRSSAVMSDCTQRPQGGVKFVPHRVRGYSLSDLNHFNMPDLAEATFAVYEQDTIDLL